MGEQIITLTEEYTAESYSRKSELNDIKQHADKIIQGIKGLTEKDAKRAIWELFQNAIDITENCEVTINLTEDTLTFEHNGEPFNPSTLDCLFKQVSSKTLEEVKINFDNNEPVGQFGTGFITTHQFGKIIEITGSLKKKGGYVPLQEFRIDRTTNNWQILRDEIYNLKQKLESLLRGNTTIEEPIKTTSFKYLFGSKQNKERATNAVESLSSILPYVMILNDRLKKVSVINQQGNKTIYTKPNPEIGTNIREREIFIDNKPKIIKYLKSDRLKIILPLNISNEAFYFENNLPKLFLFYPLVGTEEFGFNFLLHSRNFLPTEPRDGLYLKSSNEDNKTEEQANQSLIEEASSMIFNYIENNWSNIVNPIKLAKINFNIDNIDNNLNDYFIGLKKEWINRFKEYKLVHTAKEKISPSNAAFIDSELLEVINDENDKTFNSVYSIASKFYENIPLIEIVREWTARIDEWDLEEIEYINFGSLATHIKDKENLREFNPMELITFYEFIFKKGHGDLFNSISLLPNIKGEFRKLSDLSKSVELTKELIDIADVINPNISNRQINPDFIFNTELESFGRRKYTNQLNIAIEEKVQLNTKGKELPENYLRAMVQFASITTSENSSSTPLMIVEDICKYYSITYDLIVIIPNKNKEDELDVRTTQKRLLRCFLNDISQEDAKWVNEYHTYLFEVLQKIVGYSEYLEIYKNVSVFPNQLQQLCQLSQLNIDNNIPSDIKEIYDKVVKPEFSIKTELIDADFNNIHKEGKKKNTNDLTAKIEDVFFGENNQAIKINNHKYKKEILDIIKLFKENDQSTDKSDAISYQGYYPRLNLNKSSILVQLADSDDSFSILSLDTNRIKKLASIGNDPDLFDIIQLGKDAVEKLKQEKGDFQYKKTLGNHLEEILCRKLQANISQEITANVADVQNGQDLIIFVGDQPAYYIEVKSKWKEKTPIRISRKQTITAHKQKERYALCSIDMTSYWEKDRYEVDSVDKIKHLMKFNNDVGEKVGHLIEILNETNDPEKFSLYGDYRTMIPKSYIDLGNNLEEFEDNLIAYLKINYGKQN
ncbi:MAG: DUF3883 domain-containing protein [Bacteroidales bacterium]|nr:DUF3883 domain-containing protein [Bacteroidales bacterium]